MLSPLLRLLVRVRIGDVNRTHRLPWRRVTPHRTQPLGMRPDGLVNLIAVEGHHYRRMTRRRRQCRRVQFPIVLVQCLAQGESP